MNVACYVLLGALPCAIVIKLLECVWLSGSLWYWKRRIARLRAENDRLVREISVMTVVAGEALEAGRAVAIRDDGRAYTMRVSP